MATREWSKTRQEAAQLIADGELSDTLIGKTLKISRTSIWEWRKDPDFTARVDEIREETAATLRKRAIAIPERRIARLNDTWLRLQRVIEERAADPAFAKAAGGTTGLMVRTEKMLGSGDGAMYVTEFAVDTGLLKELRDIEKQAAIELKQWTEKSEIKTETGDAQTIRDLLDEAAKSPA